MPVNRSLVVVPAAVVAVAVGAASLLAQKPDGLDAKVQHFLLSNRYSWRDMNVPEADGRALHDLVVERSFKRALEIGTSTGHSGIWIGWALSKTGGKLITIDIDEGRHREALVNFREAGVASFIDARLADAHDLVPKLDGPWDFVFIDADKDWYTNYAKAVIPKLRVGGCLTAHNVSAERGRRQMTGDFYEYVAALPFLESSFRAGVFVACRTKN
ncbi:MAG: methyltransferase [Candidatus Rokuibacteriota bacterium]|nr:MAG: methyltransferase [Candidatus Rokubacteria bacterium]